MLRKNHPKTQSYWLLALMMVAGVLAQFLSPLGSSIVQAVNAGNDIYAFTDSGQGSIARHVVSGDFGTVIYKTDLSSGPGPFGLRVYYDTAIAGNPGNCNSNHLALGVTPSKDFPGGGDANAYGTHLVNGQCQIDTTKPAFSGTKFVAAGHSEQFIDHSHILVDGKDTYFDSKNDDNLLWKIQSAPDSCSAKDLIAPGNPLDDNKSGNVNDGTDPKHASPKSMSDVLGLQRWSVPGGINTNCVIDGAKSDYSFPLNPENFSIYFRWSDQGTITTSDVDAGGGNGFTFSQSGGAGPFSSTNRGSCKDQITANVGEDHGTIQIATPFPSGYPGFLRSGYKTSNVNGCLVSDPIGIKISNAKPASVIPPGQGPQGGAGVNNNQNHCNISDGLGWILCPVIKVADETVTTLEGLVLQELEPAPLTTTTNSNGTPVEAPIYRVWGVFRNLTNVFFVFVFFAMIFGNSFGIDAYTVKKVLPRLVAAVILVQFSFFLSAFAIDAVNIMGKGLSGLLAPLSNLSAPDATGTTRVFGGVLDVAALALGGIAAFAAGLLPALLLILLGAVISILGVFVTLQLRLIVLDVLVMASPIAFAAWVLPNTEKLFKMWWSNLIKLLLMFPIVVTLIYAGGLASQLPQLTSGSQTGVIDVLQKLLSSLAPVLVWLSIPAIALKAPGSIIGSVSGAVRNRAQRASKGLTSGDLMKHAQETRKRKAGELLNPQGPGWKRALGAVATGNAFSFGRVAKHKKGQAYSAALEESRKLYQAEFEHEGIAGNNGALYDRYKASKNTAEKIAIMRMLGDNNGIEELNSIYEDMRANNKDESNSSKWENKTSKNGRGRQDRELWERGTANARPALAKALPYTVRPDDDRSLIKLDAEGLANTKGAAGQFGHFQRAISESNRRIDEANAILKDPTKDTNAKREAQTKKDGEILNQRKFITSWVGVLQSTDRRGRTDTRNSEAFADIVDRDLFHSEVGPESRTVAARARTHIKENGRMEAMPEKGGLAAPPTPPPAP